MSLQEVKGSSHEDHLTSWKGCLPFAFEREEDILSKTAMHCFFSLLGHLQFLNL